MDQAQPQEPRRGEESASAGERRQRHTGRSSAGGVNGGVSAPQDPPDSASSASPSTTYWCVSENTDSPSLLSPVPGPSSKEGRGAGGRDHRRYYHEYWRSEYLMDFEPQTQGLICMVCGSSLATLKLSTIKRHIRQKHSYSLLWSHQDKELIRRGWDTHLSTQQTLSTEREAASASPEPVSSRVTAVQDVPTPTAEVMERYLNDSLHAWFRQEFLMEYRAEQSRLTCMVCGDLLPSLHLEHIKSHVLLLHPASLLYTAQQKHHILQTWTSTHTHDSAAPPPAGVKREAETKESHTDTPGSPQHQALPYLPRRGRGGRRLKSGSPWRLRLDHLVAFGPPEKPLCYCMVCSQHLTTPRVSSFRRHAHQCHPHTSSLSHAHRQQLANAWMKQENIDRASPEEESTLRGEEATEVSAVSAGAEPKLPEVKVEPEEATPPARPRHYPGKDQRRNYQPHWRRDFLMDYDCRQHGLICMVCGSALATLKVSTIKRHIVQVHPHSLTYDPEERQLVLDCYAQISPRPGHAQPSPAPASST